MAEDFDIGLPTISDFEVLRDREDASTCERLNERYGGQIETKIQLFEGGEPEYLYDISYYKGAGFYAVVLAGGVLIQHDPLNPDREAYYAAPFGANVLLFDEQLNLILDRFREPLNKSTRSAFPSEKPQIVRCDTSDSSRRYGRVAQRARCGFSGETPTGRAFAGPPPRLGSLIWNDQTTLAQAETETPAKAPSRPRRLVQRFLSREGGARAMEIERIPACSEK